MWTATAIFLIIWVAISVWMLLSQLGDPNPGQQKTVWWEWVLFAPVLAIAGIIGVIRKIFGYR